MDDRQSAVTEVRRDDAVAALDAAARAVAGVLDPDEVLQAIADLLRPLVDARYAAIGIIAPDGMLERFITSGLDAETRARIGATPRGHGLLGLIVRENRTIRTPDLMTHPDRYGFPPNHPDMHSFLGVPVTVGGQTIGNLYLTEKQGSPEFSDADVQLVEAFALHAGIAMERARLADEVRRLALVDERERIRRDLHDGIIQSLYAVSLSLEDVPELMAEQPEDAAERVERAIDDLHAAIRDIRNFITGLRPEALEEFGLRSGIEAIADEARGGGFRDVTVILEVDLDPSSPAVVHLLHVVREAVSNAIRHGNARTISIALRQHGQDIVLEVVDDGVGFDDRVDADVGHHGLMNLRARANSLGGDLQVASRPGTGTRIAFRLPAERVGVIHDTGATRG